MPYSVTANITGEPATIQSKDGQTLFSNRGEAEQFQRDLRQAGFDRVDIVEGYEDKPAGYETAPASTPDRQGRLRSSIEIVEDVKTLQNVPFGESTQYQQQQLVEQRLENLDRAIAERPQIAGIRQSVTEQIIRQAQGDFGQRRLNLTPSERLQQEAHQAEAQRIAERTAFETTAGGIIKGFRQLPEAYQTSQSLRNIAEVSKARQELPKSLYSVGGLGGGDGKSTISSRDSTSSNLGFSDSFNNLVYPKEEKRESFERRIEELGKRKEQFFTSKGFERIRDTAAILTGGIRRSQLRGDLEIIPIEQRGFIGTTAQEYLGGLMGFPIALGGFLPSVGGKLAATGEAFFKSPETRERVKEEVIVGAPSRLQETEILNPTTPQGVATYLTAVTFGLLGASAATLKGQTGFGIRQAKLNIERFQVPAEETPSTLYTGLTGTLGQRGTPLVGVSQGNIVFGTPKIELSNLKSPLIPQEYVATPAKARILATNLPQAPSQEFSLGLPVMRTTETTPSAFVTQQFIKESKTLTPEEIIKVINLAKKDDALVYGSFAARQQAPEGVLRKAGDIDLQLKLGQAETEAKAQQLATQLGNNFRVTPDNPTLIQKNVQGRWVNAVDIHSKTEVSYGTGESVFGLQLGQKPINIESTKVMPLSEQGLRKGASVFTLRTQEGGVLFAPEPHRVKDIGDFFATQEVLLRSKIISNPIAEAKLAELKGLFEKRFPEAFEGQPEIKFPLSLEESRTPSSSRLFYSGLPSEFISMLSIPVSEQSIPILSSVSIQSRSLPSSVSIPSQRPSVSPSASFLGSGSPSPSNKISPPSVSIFKSPSTSPSISTNISISPSPSPSKSISPSVSPSTYLSPSPSPSPYLSPSVSPYPSPSPSTTTTITPKGKSSLSKSLSTQFKKQAYNVLIKAKQQKLSKGKYKSRGFTKANKEPLTRLAAEGLGKQIADTYANRSFTISKAKGSPIERKDLENAASALAFKFRTAKKNKNIFVEKETYAIDNPLEVSDIPYEALRQRRNQKIKNILTFKKQQILSKIRQKLQNNRVVSLFAPTKNIKRGQRNDLFLTRKKKSKKFKEWL